MITWVKRIGEEASILVNSLRVSIAAEYFDSNSTTASTLQIHHIMPVDQALYQCEASNEAGTSATAQAVQIIGKPKECLYNKYYTIFMSQKETIVNHNHARMVERVFV